MRPSALALAVALLATTWMTASAEVEGAAAEVSRQAQAYQLYSMAQQSLLQRDYSDALSLLERAVTRDGSPGLLLELAQLHFSLNNLDPAADLARQIISREPGSAGAHRLLGDIHLSRAREGKDTEANVARSIDEYRASLEADPADQETCRTLAELYYHTGRLQEAGDLLASFAQKHTLEPAMSLLLGKVYVRTGHYDDAETILQRIVAKSPMNLEAADALGALYEFKSQYDKAIAVYMPLLKDGVQRGYLLDRIGSLHLQAGRYDEAIRELLEGQKMDPEDSRGMLALAQAYEGAERYGDAVDAYDALIKREPGNLEARFHKARLQVKQGELGVALTGFRGLIDLANGRGAVSTREAAVLAMSYSQIGLIEMDARNYEGAAEAFMSALHAASDPGPELFLLLGRATLEAHKLEEAERVALEAMRRHPDNLGLLILRGEVLVARGDLAEARAFYRTLLDDRGRSPEAYAQIGEALLRQKSYEEADILLKEGTRLHPEDDSLLFTRGAAMEHMGRVGEAERCLSKAIDINPKNAMALNYLAYMLADRGLRLRDSIAYVQRALALEPNNPAFLDSLGWAQFKLSLFKPAENSLRAALKFDRSDPTIREHLGDLLVATGRLEEAVREWQEALERGHEEPERVRGKLEKARASLKAAK